MTCPHAKTKPGPRFPLLHGSSETEVCRQCRAYRLLHHGRGPWQSSDMAQDISRVQQELDEER